MHCIMRVQVGENIPNIVKTLTRYRGLTQTHAQKKIEVMASGCLQLCQNLLGRAADAIVLTGEFFDEEILIRDLPNKEVAVFNHINLHLMGMLPALMNENSYAYSFYKKFRTNLNEFMPLSTIPVYTDFFRGLVSAALARESKGWERKRYLAEAKLMLTKLKKHMLQCPDNVTSKIGLIEAELEFGKGRYSLALLKYDQAIASAELKGLVSDQAIACEKAGRMLEHASRRVDAIHYLQEARKQYMAWGAQIKVDQMDALLLATRSR
jgi:hypothetical protein